MSHRLQWNWTPRSGAFQIAEWLVKCREIDEKEKWHHVGWWIQLGEQQLSFPAEIESVSGSDIGQRTGGEQSTPDRIHQIILETRLYASQAKALTRVLPPCPPVTKLSDFWQHSTGLLYTNSKYWKLVIALLPPGHRNRGWGLSWTNE